MIPAVRFVVFTVVLGALVAACGGPSDPGAPPAAPDDVRTQAGAGFVTVSWSHDGQGVASFEVRREEVASAGLRIESTRTVAARGSAQVVRESVPRESDHEGLPALTASATVVGSTGSDARTFVDDGVETGVGYRYEVVAVSADGASSAAASQAGDPAVSSPPSVEAGENPDPDRYLAARVLDDAGRALPSATASFRGQGDEAFARSFWARADEQGVGLLADVVERPALRGSYDGFLWIQPGWDTVGSPMLARLDGVDVPGTVTADPRDEGLTDLGVQVTRSGEPVAAEIQFGASVGGTAYLDEDFAVTEAATNVRIAPADYPYILTVRNDDGVGYHLWGDVSVGGPGTLGVEVEDAPSSTLQASASIEGPGSVDRTSICPRSDDDEGVDQFLSLCLSADTIHATPKLYSGGVYVDAIAPDGVEWWYRFWAGEFDLRPAGSSVDVSVGAPLTATIEATSSSYQVSDEVRVDANILDAAGNALTRIENDASGEWSDVLVEVELRDARDTVVVRRELEMFELESGDILLGVADSEGVHTLALAVDTGPLAGEVVATGTIDVAPAPAAGLATEASSPGATP